MMGNADSKIKEAQDRSEKLAIEKNNLIEECQQSLNQKEKECKEKIREYEKKLEQTLATREKDIENRVAAVKDEYILKKKSDLEFQEKLNNEGKQKLLSEQELESSKRVQEVCEKKDLEAEKLKESYEAELKKTEENCQAELQRKNEAFEKESKRKETEYESLLEKERQKNVDFQAELVKKQNSREHELDCKENELIVTEKGVDEKLLIIEKWRKDVEKDKDMKERDQKFREFRTRYYCGSEIGVLF